MSCQYDTLYDETLLDKMEESSIDFNTMAQICEYGENSNLDKSDRSCSAISELLLKGTPEDDNDTVVRESLEELTEKTLDVRIFNDVMMNDYEEDEIFEKGKGFLENHDISKHDCCDIKDIPYNVKDTIASILDISKEDNFEYFSNEIPLFVVNLNNMIEMKVEDILEDPFKTSPLEIIDQILSDIITFYNPEDNCEII